MIGAANIIGLINIIGPDPDRQELLHELPHRLDVIIDAFEQNSLVAEGDPGISQQIQRPGRFRRNFIRMIEVNVHIKRVIFFEN